MNKTAQHRLTLGATMNALVTNLHARALHFAMMDGAPMLWTEYDPGDPPITVQLRVIQNGVQVPAGHTHIGTAVQVGASAWHLYAPSNQFEEGRFISAPPST